MSTYASAVRRATMAAARLHRELGTAERVVSEGGRVDVFDVAARLNVPLLFRPLEGLLGAFLNDPMPGVLITTQRPLSVQRFTTAHELGHERLGHKPSLDDESMLVRSPFVARPAYPIQEVEADAFAVTFLMPRWLITWHCEHQGWIGHALQRPNVVYQLSLRIGASYQATCWTLARYQLLSRPVARRLAAIEPRGIKAELLGGYEPPDFRGDVWTLSEVDRGMTISGSRSDLFVLRLPEHSGSGYLWNFDQLQDTGFVLVRDEREGPPEDAVGGPVTRRVTALSRDRQQGELRFSERRPWQPTAPANTFSIRYDLTGPEQKGLSRAERQRLLETV
jgi:Zn-dependent peptidase ImmA (M78 family)/predicted secreted protein